MMNITTEGTRSVMFDTNVTGSHNLTSDTYESLEDLNERYANALIPVLVLLGLFAVVGILGNILVIVVFSSNSQYKNNNFRVFVICLAIIDLIACVSLIPAEMAKIRNHFSFPNATPCKVKCFFNTFGMAAAAFTLLIISIDRFRKVCQPLKKQIMPDQALRILLVVLTVSFLLTLPAPFLCGISTANKTNIFNTSTTVYMCTAEKKFQKSVWRWLYKSSLTICVLLISVTLLVLYCLIVRTVIRHWRSRSTGSSVRFESNKSEDISDRVEVDRLTDDVFSPEDIKTVANNSENGKIYTKDNKTGKGMMLSRKTSSISLSSGSLKDKFYVRRGSNQRKGSDASYRSYAVRRRSSTTGPGKIPYKTLIWLILTVIFISTYLLYAILSFLVPNVYKMSPGKLMVYLLFYRLYFINNVINPFIYGILDQRFKGSCKRLFASVKQRTVKCC